MKKLKTLIFLTLLGFGTSIYAQSKDALLPKTNLFKSFNLDFKHINFSENSLLFSSYNETTKLNDIYLLNNDSFIYSKSSLILENNFRGHKIDSYNPHGTSCITSSLILGLVNSILK